MRFKVLLATLAVASTAFIAVQAQDRVGLYLRGTNRQRGGDAIAQETANLYVYDGAKVKAYDQTKIWAHDTCSVEAYGQATVEAKAETKIRAFDTSRIIATNSAN